jgi:hypothetical protein
MVQQEKKSAILRRRAASNVHASVTADLPSLKHGALSLMDQMRYEIDSCLKRQDDKTLHDVFKTYEQHFSRGFKEGDEGLVKENLKAALEELNIKEHGEIIENVMKNTDVDKNGFLDFEEFRLAVRQPTAMEQWTSSLPINNVVAAALYPLVGLHPEFKGSNGIDPLRALSSCSDDHLRSACDAIMEGILKVLSRRVQELKNSFKSMDDNPVRVKEDIEQSKFGVGTMNGGIGTMSCGDIPSFFEGLGGRVGS